VCTVSRSLLLLLLLLLMLCRSIAQVVKLLQHWSYSCCHHVHAACHAAL
jgi:hypothetical protein